MFLHSRFYGFFLSINIVKAKPIAIATIMPATAGTKYESLIDVIEICVGVGVAAVSSTTKAVSAEDG